MKPDESEEKQNATCASALDTILKSLWKISVFRKELLSFTENEYVFQLCDFILKIAHPMESNGVFLELLPRWKSGYEEEDPLKSKFQVYETAQKICNRCKMDTEYPPNVLTV